MTRHISQDHASTVMRLLTEREAIILAFSVPVSKSAISKAAVEMKHPYAIPLSVEEVFEHK
jgi:hypothetical protein